jgi:leucyl aminopeptidase
MIDYATLTGAILVALGDELTGYFANTKAYDKKLAAASLVTAESFWPMPASDEYKDHMKSLIADIKNVGEKNLAGATTAALFLKHFVKNNDWIHFDIAGTAWTMRPKRYVSAGATAWGVYLTVEFLRNLKHN